MWGLSATPAAEAISRSGNGSPVVTWALLLGAGLVAVAVAALRLVPAEHVAVVRRSGGRTRVAGPGLLVRLPLVEQVELLPTREVDVPLAVVSHTGEAVRVRILGTLVSFVVSAQQASTVSNPHASAADAAERRIAELVGRHSVDDLVFRRPVLEQQLRRLVDQEAHRWGLAVERVRLDSVDTDLTPATLGRLRYGGFDDPALAARQPAGTRCAGGASARGA